MGFFDLFKSQDINAGVEDYKSTPGAVLLDVRSKSEYQQGHIPGSINVPVDHIESVVSLVPDKKTPVFSYCLAGSRSARAVAAMKRLGYEQVVNIGGINSYKGALDQ